jgi:CHAT domain-containing protein/tetratricopeptide (TPR) repeat protein
MVEKGTWRAATLIGLAVLLAVAAPLPVRGQGTDDLAAMRDQLRQLQRQGKYTEAISIAEQYVALARRRHGEEHTEFATAIAWLGLLYKTQGRYAEAEPLYKRTLTIYEKAFGREHPWVGTALNNIAELYRAQGRYAEAEPLYKRTLAIKEKALGPDHPDVGISLNNLAELYVDQGRYVEVEQLFKRSLAIREKALGPDHPDVGMALSNLADLYRHQGRYAEAEPLLKRALAITEKALGPEHPSLAIGLNNLATLYYAQGRYGEAEPLMKRALAIGEKALGPDHPIVGTRLNNLAELYQAQGRYADVEPLFKRALTIAEKSLGPDHPDVDRDFNNLAGLYFVQRDWSRAAEFWRRGTAVVERRAQRGTLTVGQPLTGRGKSEAFQLAFEFRGLVKSVYRLTTRGRASSQEQAAEMFEAAQWVLASEAASSLAQMAARGAKGEPKLAGIVRERQDLVAEWQKRNGARSAAVSQAPDKRDRAAEAANTNRLAEVDMRIAAIDERLKVDFPDYAALLSLAPLSVADAQVLLGSDEALVLFLDTPEWNPTTEETFVWVVTKTETRWVRSELGTPSLKREVATLRCGLDYDGTWGTSGSHCADLLQITYTEADHEPGKPLPFDRDRAHALYKALFGQIEDVIKDKQLLVVPSGVLTQLPFQVLITEKPDPAASGDDAFRRAAWFVRIHALTVLPAVSSLKALRQLAKDSHADRAMIGFGNPLLDGPDARFWKLASNARDKQSCPATPEKRVAALSGERRGVLPLDLHRGLADASQIRVQVPLPETADELCAVARDMRVSDNDIRLGARATEAEIKRLSEAGELSKYRVVHFATHGALSGQVSGSSEPGLLLTPPDKATEIDDGYLSASEIAALKLDADWVILSACNTAAAGADGAEALSGLARAFFYAGARALLVSHWAVDSDATVKLITGAVDRMAADKRVGRAEAMRQSMLALIDTATADEAHPAFWAPFVVVGEGAAPM